MEKNFAIIAASTQFVRLQRNVNQETAAYETGVSLRTIQNIEAGKAVNSSSLFAYLNYLDLLDNMLSTLPDPTKLTPMELLKATPNRRSRARGSVKYSTPSAQTDNKNRHVINDKIDFQWGDEK